MGLNLAEVIDAFCEKVNRNWESPSWLSCIPTPLEEGFLETVESVSQRWNLEDFGEQPFSIFTLTGECELEIQWAGNQNPAATLELTFDNLGLRFNDFLIAENNAFTGIFLRNPEEATSEENTFTIALNASGGTNFPQSLQGVLERSRILNTPFFITATIHLIGQGSPIALRHVEVDFPADFGLDPKDETGQSKLVITNASFSDEKGFNGTISLGNVNADGSIVKLLGNDFALTNLQIPFQTKREKGAASQFSITGKLNLPFFENEITVTLNINSDSETYVLGITLDEDRINLPDDNPCCSVKITKLQVSHGGDQSMLMLDGSIRPESGLCDFLGIADEDAEEVQINFEGLSIDSDGRVDIKGGWLDLTKMAALPVGPFALQVEKIGLKSSGRQGEYRELILAGELSLVDGAPPAKLGQGITIKWKTGESDYEIIPQEASFDIQIPGVFGLKGSIARVTENVACENESADSVLFRGSASLDVKAANFKVGASVLAGTQCGDIVFYFFADVESPVPIPLGQSGLGIYGIKAGAGLNTAPNLDGKNSQGKPVELIDLYRERYQKYDMTDVRKLKAQSDSATMLAGVTLGTSPDASFAARFGGLLMLSVPGPLLFIEAKAQIIKLPIKVSAETFDIESTIVAGFAFDLDKATLWIALNASFEIPLTLSVGGAGEAFFDFKDADRWHLFLGKDQPRKNRIKGEWLAQYRGEAYLMLDAGSVRTGTRFGYGPSYVKGPLNVALQLFIEGGVEIGWSIPQAKGQLIVGGEAALKIFNIGPRALIQGTLGGTFPSPTKLSAKFEIEVDGVWPLEPVRTSFLWEILFAQAPKVDNPIVGAVLSHKHTPQTWPMVASREDLPAAGDAEGFTSLEVAEVGTANVPRLVPIDANPLINFARAMGDQAGPLAYPPRAAWESERAGIYDISYGLTELRLTAVSETGETPVTTMNALWLPTPGGGSALQLLSDTPFPGYIASSWERIMDPENRKFYDEPTSYRHLLFFDTLRPGIYTPADDFGVELALPLRLGDTVIDSYSGFMVVEAGVVSGVGEHAAILLAPRESLEILLPEGWVDVQVAVPKKSAVNIIGWTASEAGCLGTLCGSFNDTYDLYGFGKNQIIQKLRIKPNAGPENLSVVLPVVALLWEIHRGFKLPETSCPYSGTTLLSPHTDYRLDVTTLARIKVIPPESEGQLDVVVDLEGIKLDASGQFYFRTGGPPADLSPYFVYGSVGDPRPRSQYQDIPLAPGFAVPLYRLAPDKGYPAYRAYDVRLHWGAVHVRAMFEDKVALQLSDQTGVLMGTAWRAVWEKSPYRFLSTVDAAWLAAYGCDDARSCGDDLLTLRVGAMPLPAQQTLTAEVVFVSRGRKRQERCLCRLEFDTSRYLNLQDHLDSSGHALHGLLEMKAERAGIFSAMGARGGKGLTVKPPNASTSTAGALPESIREVVPACWSSCEEEADAFISFANRLREKLPRREERLGEGVALYVVEEAPGYPVALYLQSPEPFAWERICLDSVLVPPPGYHGKPQKAALSAAKLYPGIFPHHEPRENFSVRALRNFDGTAVFLFYEWNGGLVYLPGGHHELHFNLRWNIGHGAPILSSIFAERGQQSEDAYLKFFVEAVPPNAIELLPVREQMNEQPVEYAQAVIDTIFGRTSPSVWDMKKKGGDV